MFRKFDLHPDLGRLFLYLRVGIITEILGQSERPYLEM